MVIAVATGILLSSCSQVSPAVSPTRSPSGVPIGFSPLAVFPAGSSGGLLVTGTVPCGTKTCPSLVRGSVGTDGLVDRWQALTPPPITPTVDPGALEVGTLVFANRLEGYDLVPSGVPYRTIVYATTNGGRQWHQVTLGSGTVFGMAATTSSFYAVTASCTGSTCHDYRLAHAAVGGGPWSSVPIPGTSALNGSPVSLAASKSHVFLNFDPPVPGSHPLLLTSGDGNPPFQVQAAQELTSVAACQLIPGPDSVLWAACPTGMLISYLRSPNGAAPFTNCWTYSGTGGGGIAPVDSNVVYRYTGIPSSAPQAIPANTLQLSTDAAKTFTTVGPLPSGTNQGGFTRQLLFPNQHDGFWLGVTGAASPSVMALYETNTGGRQWSKALP